MKKILNSLIILAMLFGSSITNITVINAEEVEETSEDIPVVNNEENVEEVNEEELPQEEIVNEEVIEENTEEVVEEETTLEDIEEETTSEEIEEEPLVEEIIIEEVVEEVEVVSEVAKTTTTNETPKTTSKYAKIKNTEASINGFVVRLYRIALTREPDEKGFDYWTKGIKNKSISGAMALRGFFLSKEMKNRKLSNEEFVKSLYRVALNREAEKAGLKYWTDRLNVKMTRESVIKGFVDSKEFGELCKKYKVNRGSINSPNNYRDRNYNVTAFVSRMYTKALGRNSDISGLEYWCSSLLNKSGTGASLVEGFFFSKEFTNKKLSNEEFVKTAYRTILNREADEKGLKYWTGKLKEGATRRSILSGFVSSKEFTALCKEYKIERGSLSVGWNNENGKKTYNKNDGTKAKKEVIVIDGKECAFDGNGYYVGDKSAAYISAFKKAIKFVDSVTNSSMSQEQQLQACFNELIDKKYPERNPWIPHDRSDGWVERYANHWFDENFGNCFSSASAFAFCARVIGYTEVYGCSNGAHGWTEIDGYIYDPNWAKFQPGNYFRRDYSEPHHEVGYLNIDRTIDCNSHRKL